MATSRVLGAADAPPLKALPRQTAGVAWPTQAWPLAPPAAEVDADKVNGILDRAFPDPADKPFGLSLATVVVHQGQLVAERYGPTAGPDEALISWSMGKSVTQALVGILIKQGRLSIADRVVPEWDNVGDSRAEITLDHLLRMVPGTEFNEDYVDDQASHCIEMLFGGGRHDMAAYTASLAPLAPPDTVFNYSSGTTNLVCRAIAAVVGAGDAFDAWAKAELLHKIGMHSASLTFDGAGTWVGSSFLNATARDFAKFGLLYLRDGMWDGQRVLPEGWVDYARTQRAIDEEGRGYGAHWWMGELPGAFCAKGYETQRIIIDPDRDLVVVRLGKTPAEHAAEVDAWLVELMECFPAR